MNNKKYIITILGNFSGRNAGDNAILDNIMNDIYQELPNVIFNIPTINTRFIKNNFSHYPVNPISILPWNLSIKMLGLPTLKSILQSDLTLVSDAILFDRKIFNPLVNYLSSIAIYTYFMKKYSKTLFFYNVSLGPITSITGEKLLHYVSKAAKCRCLRDAYSYKLLIDRLSIKENNYLAADSAINTKATEEEKINEILNTEGISTEKPLVGINLNAYIDTYYKKTFHFDAIKFKKLISSIVDYIIKHWNVNVLFVVTQHMDIKINKEVMGLVKNKNSIYIITNKRYTHRDLTGVFKRMDLVFGMRTHALILAASVGTPVAGMISYPKTKGFLDYLGLNKNYLEIDDNFNYDNIVSFLNKIWHGKDKTKKIMEDNVGEMKIKASHSAKSLINCLPIR